MLRFIKPLAIKGWLLINVICWINQKVKSERDHQNGGNQLFMMVSS